MLGLSEGSDINKKSRPLHFYYKRRYFGVLSLLPVQKGGEATADSHGKDFYKEIGEKGGKARKNN
ncbi:hypothetical protein H7T43_23575 [Peribacillus simplex]|nr:hypothetical protein [Peribacillus simplex]